jgi:hypothetical protein
MAYHYLWPDADMPQNSLLSWLVSAATTAIARSVPRRIVFRPGRAWTTL